MIVGEAALRRLRGRATLVDGVFDPVHHGHIAYLAGAARLGRPLVCSVASDDHGASKHRLLLKQRHRVEIIDAVRFIDYTHAARTTTERVIELLRPRRYVKGADWRGRLPREQVELCEAFGVEVVFLDTVLASSSDLMRTWLSDEERLDRAH